MSGDWELRDRAMELTALGHRLGEALLILVASCPSAGGFMAEDDLATLLERCGREGLRKAWHQITLEPERFTELDWGEVAALLHDAGDTEAARDALGLARPALTSAVVAARVEENCDTLVAEWEAARREPPLRLAVLRAAAAAGCVRSLDVTGAASGATAAESQEIARLLAPAHPAAEIDALAAAAGQHWDVAVSDANHGDRVKALCGLAECGDRSRLLAFAADPGNDMWLRHRAGLGLIDLGGGSDGAPVLQDLLALDRGSLHGRFYERLEVYRRYM